METLPPNKSALATNFKVGDQVKWMLSQDDISPYVGRVSDVCPGINKLWVEFPVGGNQQMDPSELILVPPEQGISPVQFSTGYSNYDKAISNRDYGTLSDPKVVKLAQTLISRGQTQEEKVRKMASEVAKKYSSEVVENICDDILDGFKNGYNEVSVYDSLYKKYAGNCPDGFLRHAVSRISELISDNTKEEG